MEHEFNVYPGHNYSLMRDDNSHYWLFDNQRLAVTSPETESFWKSFFHLHGMSFPQLEPGQSHDFTMTPSI